MLKDNEIDFEYLNSFATEAKKRWFIRKIRELTEKGILNSEFGPTELIVYNKTKTKDLKQSLANIFIEQLNLLGYKYQYKNFIIFKKL